PDGSRIGEPVAVPATAAETPSEAAAPTHPAGPSTADVKIKKAGIYIIEVGQYRKLHTFLKLAIRTGHLIAFLGASPHTEIAEITVIAFGSDFQVEHPFRIPRAVAGYIGHIAIVVHNLDFFHDFSR